MPKRSIISFITPTLSLGSRALRIPTSLDTKSNLTTRPKTIYVVLICKTAYWKPWWSHVLFESGVLYWHEHQMLSPAVAFRSKRVKMLVICRIVKLAEFFHVTSNRSDRSGTCSTVAFPSVTPTPSEATRWLCKRVGRIWSLFLIGHLILHDWYYRLCRSSKPMIKKIMCYKHILVFKVCWYYTCEHGLPWLASSSYCRITDSQFSKIKGVSNGSRNFSSMWRVFWMYIWCDFHSILPSPSLTNGTG